MYEQDLGEGMFDYYMRIYSIHQEKYGKVAVLLQNGSFFEIYGVDNEKERLGNINEICDTINLKVGKKDNKLPGNDRSNHLLGGFQPAQLEKYAPVLIDNGFTIILVEQFGKNEKDVFVRKVSRIISSSTYLEDVSLINTKKTKNKTLLCIYFEFNKKNELTLVSMSSIDLSLGKCVLFSITNDVIDKQKCIDETFRFIHTISPIELIIYVDNELSKSLCSKILKELSVNNLDCNYHLKIVPIEYTKVCYQNEFLETIYNKKDTMLDAIDYLQLNKYPSLSICFVLLLRFAYEHDETIIKNIHYPIFWDNSNYLILENNAIYQLNVTKTHTIQYSLIELLDKTSTTIGRRLHKSRLLNPIVNVEILKRRYKQIQWMNNKIEIFEDLLKKVLDIERLHRKIENSTIQPYDFVLLEKSYENIENIMVIMNELSSEEKELFYFWNPTIFERFQNWRKAYTSIFNIRGCDYKLDNMKDGRIFHSGIDHFIDEIQIEINSNLEKIKHIQIFISDKLNEFQTNPKKKKDCLLIDFDRNNKEEFYFTITKTREAIFKKHIEKDVELLGWSKFERKNMSSGYKLTSKTLDDIGEKIIELENRLQSRCLEVFYDKVKELYQCHKYIFNEVVNFIGEIDWIKSSAKVAKDYNYCCPKIEPIELNKSYIKSINIRHPIIEKILEDTHYVPNDITIGIKEDGILLFGTNSSGKSSLMKSIGVNVIMAQSGMFVASDEFIYYPYNNIITRITGEDNFSKGFSSFVVEMTELRTILNRSTKNSLILGDEICHGTEQISGLALVASGIIELSKKQSSFIFATHLHNLSKLEEINSLTNIRFKHLKVIYNEDEDTLIYDRKLEDGPGSDLYGIEVAKYIIQDQPTFLKNAIDIRRKVLNVPKELVSTRKSKYNAKLILDKCKICGKDAVDTHHIDFQCTADDDGFIEKEKIKFHKNVKANLVTLCKRCHINVHHSIDGKQIIIEGYTQTSKGTILNWGIKDV